MRAVCIIRLLLHTPLTFESMDDILFQSAPSQSAEILESEAEEATPSPKRDRFSSAILIGLVFFLPIFFVPFSGTQLQSVKTVLAVLVALLAFALLIARRLRDGSIEFPKTAVAFSIGSRVHLIVNRRVAFWPRKRG